MSSWFGRRRSGAQRCANPYNPYVKTTTRTVTLDTLATPATSTVDIQELIGTDHLVLQTTDDPAGAFPNVVSFPSHSELLTAFDKPAIGDSYLMLVTNASATTTNLVVPTPPRSVTVGAGQRVELRFTVVDASFVPGTADVALEVQAAGSADAGAYAPVIPIASPVTALPLGYWLWNSARGQPEQQFTLNTTPISGWNFLTGTLPGTWTNGAHAFLYKAVVQNETPELAVSPASGNYLTTSLLFTNMTAGAVVLNLTDPLVDGGTTTITGDGVAGSVWTLPIDGVARVTLSVVVAGTAATFYAGTTARLEVVQLLP